MAQGFPASEVGIPNTATLTQLQFLLLLLALLLPGLKKGRKKMYGGDQSINLRYLYVHKAVHKKIKKNESGESGGLECPFLSIPLFKSRMETLWPIILFCSTPPLLPHSLFQIQQAMKVAGKRQKEASVAA